MITQSPELVDVPAGLATLRDRRTERSWEVEVDSFRLGATPVTDELMRRVDRSAVPDCGALHPGVPAGCVSWWAAVAFCNTLSAAEGLPAAYLVDTDREEIEVIIGSDGYRLPTEAEWEHACRAGTSGPRYAELDAIAWYRGTAGGRAHPVAAKEPNPWGLYDMLGNVWEWCWDFYDPEVYGSYRVLKGGGWDDPHWSVRTSVRRRSHPTYRIDDVGFRVARSTP